MNFLKPKDLKDIPHFTDWDNTHKCSFNNYQFTELNGKIKSKCCGVICEFSKLVNLVSREDVSRILNIVNKLDFNTNPDSVDGMSTYEIYLQGSNNNINFKKQQKQLNNIINPIMKNRIIPYIRKKYPNNDIIRQCTPCYSLIRRYKNGERKIHATHRDGHAFATMVICLSDIEKEFRGGIYVATSEKQKQIVPLSRGDAVVHKFDLLHGVKVKDDGGERWSWIIWFKDSIDCIDYSKEWFIEKAKQGNAIYQSLYSNVSNDRIHWLQKSADQGFTNSMVKLARAYLKLLPSKLEFNPQKALELYRSAINISKDPHAEYGLAQMILWGFLNNLNNKLLRVIYLLEEAAKGGHIYAMFNLGIAHLYGYTGMIDIKLANEWFKESSIPEGFYAVSLYYDSIGNKEESKKWKKRATKLGFGKKWRKKARDMTGLGGTSGVDLNLKWPNNIHGIKPEKF